MRKEYDVGVKKASAGRQTTGAETKEHRGAATHPWWNMADVLGVTGGNTQYWRSPLRLSPPCSFPQNQRDSRETRSGRKVSPTGMTSNEYLTETVHAES